MLESLIERWGYVAIALGTFFEGEAALIAGGAFAHRGLLSLPLVILVAFLGGVAGDQFWFRMGRRFGRPLLDRRPVWRARADLVQARLERHATLFVFGFRFIYGVRSLTPALLGMSGYSPVRFTYLNSAGAATWAIVIGTAGWGLGAALKTMFQRMALTESLVVAGCAAVFLGWVVYRLLQRRATRMAAKDGG